MLKACNLYTKQQDNNHLPDSGLGVYKEGPGPHPAAEVGPQTVRFGGRGNTLLIKMHPDNAVTQEMLSCCRLFGIHYRRDSQQRIPPPPLFLAF